MIRLSGSLALLSLLAGLGPVRAAPEAAPKPLVLTHVTVIDATGARPRPDLGRPTPRLKELLPEHPRGFRETFGK
jgi:hypothetical protein